MTRKGGRDASEERMDRVEREATGNGATSRSVKAFELKLVTTLRKGNLSGEA